MHQAREHRSGALIAALLAACSFRVSPPVSDLDASAEVDASIGVDASAADGAPSACAPLASGALAWWDGESIGVDILGNFSQATTTTTPPSIVLGLVGNAMNFGENQDIIVDPAPQAATFTLEAWIRRQKDDLGYMVIYGLQNESSFTLRNHRLVYFESVGGDIVASAAEIDRDVFQHVAATFDGAAIRLYIDGVIDGEATAGAGLPQPGRIGGVNLAGGQDFVGIVDELTVYNRALSASEIAAIYAAGELGKCSPADAASPSSTTPI